MPNAGPLSATNFAVMCHQQGELRVHLMSHNMSHNKGIQICGTCSSRFLYRSGSPCMMFKQLEPCVVKGMRVLQLARGAQPLHWTDIYRMLPILQVSWPYCPRRCTAQQHTQGRCGSSWSSASAQHHARQPNPWQTFSTLVLTWYQFGRDACA